jgi:molecular chaperone DnaK
MADAVQISVFQGERPMAQDNKPLGNFVLDGIPPAPRGVPQIEVTFDIDADGILHVSAQDKATGREQKITIQASAGLTEQEIKKMVHEAEAHASEDQQRKQEIETRNQADSAAYTAERSLRDLGDKVPEELRKDIQSKIDAVREALKGSSVSDIERRANELSTALQRLGEAAYQQQGGGAQQGGPQGGAQGGPRQEGGGEDTTVEGEFREV